MRLMNADDTVFYLVRALVVHVKLLTVQFMNHQQVAIGFPAKQREWLRLGLLSDVGEVASNVTELPPNRLCESLSVTACVVWTRPETACAPFPVRIPNRIVFPTEMIQTCLPFRKEWTRASGFCDSGDFHL
jgi:hypothetical protein